MKLIQLVITISLVTLTGAAVYALPVSGDSAKVYNGDYGTTPGGEFNVKVFDQATGEQNDYLAFCLETGEYIGFGVAYNIDSISEIAFNGGVGLSGDPLDEKTKWVYWNYAFNTTFASWGSGNYLADLIQQTIWTLEEETFNNAVAGLGSFIDYVNSQSSYTINGQVKVMNLSDGGNLKQSLIFGEPVPEPTTMLLFGTGLAGIAAIGRRKINQ